MQEIAVIILAAGLSSRMKGAFKPLLPLGEKVVLEQVIRIYQAAGINDIRVVTGHKAELISRVALNMNAEVVENPGYTSGMFSSVLAGLRSFDKRNHGDRKIQGFFVHPVDIPLVRVSTIKRLLECFQKNSCNIFFPVFKGRRGHPPLISSSYIHNILKWSGENGLKGALLTLENKAVDVAVSDKGVLKDMDTIDDYRMVEKRFSMTEIPTTDECLVILEEIASVPKQVKNHCVAVAKTAFVLGTELNLKGCRLDMDTITASALLHDVAREKPDHAVSGADLLRGMGFYKVADIVAVHMDFIFQENSRVNEAAVIYLADKLISKDKPVPLDQRFKPAMEKYAENPEIIESIKQRRTQAIKIKNTVEIIIGETLETLIDRNYHFIANGKRFIHL